MNDIRPIDRWELVDDARLLCNGLGGVGIVAGNDLDLDPGIVYFPEHFPYALFWGIVEHGEPQKVKGQLLLVLRESVPLKITFGHPEHPIPLFSEFLDALAEVFPFQGG